MCCVCGVWVCCYCVLVWLWGEGGGVVWEVGVVVCEMGVGGGVDCFPEGWGVLWVGCERAYGSCAWCLGSCAAWWRF